MSARGRCRAELLSRSFTRRPHWQRIAVLLAGPAFNIAFAVLVLTGLLYASGLNQVRPVLGQIEPNSLLGRAGLVSGDEITAIDSRPAHAQSDVQLELLEALSSSGPILISARSPDGAVRTVQVPITSAAQRLRLTEPALMISGLGLQFYQPPFPAQIDQVEPGEPAAAAGLKHGDLIVAVNGEPVHDFSDLRKRVQAHPGDSIAIRYRRGAIESSVRLTPRQPAARHPYRRATSACCPPYRTRPIRRAWCATCRCRCRRIRARQRRGLEHDGAAGADGLAHVDRQGVDQESEQSAEHRRIRRRCGVPRDPPPSCRSWSCSAWRWAS